MTSYGPDCVTYWKLAEEFVDCHLGRKCFELSSNEILRGNKAIGLQDVTEGMIKIAIEQDDLSTGSETDICEVLMRWCDANKNREVPTRPCELLSCIRWSGVDFEYVKLHMMNSDVLMKDRKSAEFLSKVILYKLSGVQFDGLLTFHRPASGFEMSAVIVGVVTTIYGSKSDCFRVSLQRRQTIRNLNELPVTYQSESIACANDFALYVTGSGNGCKETWRWDSVGGWVRCGDMIEGRRRHCATFVNNTSMYALGGFVDSTKTTLSSVEQYNTVKNKWFPVGKLFHSAQSVGCVAHMTSIYLFGGQDQGKSLDCIQVFNITTRQCSVLAQRLPNSEYLLRAMLWGEVVILMNDCTCLTFDLDKQTIELRNQFAAGVSHCGLVIENETLFVLGGGTSCQKGWNLTDEVKCVPVADIINDKVEVQWTQHAKLTIPCVVDTYSAITLPL